jgi:hypothetical protein
MPGLTSADMPAMRGWAELEVLSATVFAWLLKLNVLNSKGEPRRLLSEDRQMKLAQLSYESALGMTPPSRATLKLNVTRAALDLPAEMVRQVNEVGESRRRSVRQKRRPTMRIPTMLPLTRNLSPNISLPNLPNVPKEAKTPRWRYTFPWADY